MHLTELYHQHVAASFDKQMRLGDLVGDKARWWFDLEAGTLTFDDDISFRIQIIGTESEHSNTWLWAWANETSGIPAERLIAAEAVRAFGEQHGVHELIAAQLPLDAIVFGHNLLTIVAGVLNANGYYRAPYEGGAAFLLIDDPDYPPFDPDPMIRVPLYFPQVIANLPVTDHRTAFEHYLYYYDLAVERGEQEIVGRNDAGRALVGQFDAAGRCVQVRTQS